jgi:hypothetical protein
VGSSSEATGSIGLGGSSSGKLMVSSSLSFFQPYYTTTKTPGYAWRL